MRELDAVLAQDIRELERERAPARSRSVSADVLDAAHRELEVDLPVLLPGVQQLVEAEAEYGEISSASTPASWRRGHSKSVITT